MIVNITSLLKESYILNLFRLNHKEGDELGQSDLKMQIERQSSRKRSILQLGSIFSLIK
jgi:hypothetical protein